MKKIILLSFFSLFIFFGSTQLAQAASYACKCNDNKSYTVVDCTNCIEKCTAANSSLFSCNEVRATSNGSGADVSGSVKLTNPLGEGITFNKLTARIINYVLGFVGTIALLLFIYGGIIWMTSAGSAEKVKKGRDIIVWAIIGMAVIFMSYILVKVIIIALEGTPK